MTTIHASKARIPPDAFNRVVYKGERIRVDRRSGDSVFLVSREDLALLESLEDKHWARLADEAIDEMKAKGEKPVSLKDARRKKSRGARRPSA